MNHLHTTETELALAAEMLERGRVIKSGIHVRRAWDATERAEEEGEDRNEAMRLRLRVVAFGMGPWFMQAREHALNLPDDEERAEWLSGLRRFVLAGLAEIEERIVTGDVRLWEGERQPVDIARVRSDWAPILEGLELAERAPLV